MKLWSGIVTEKIQASKAFYVTYFNCEVLFDSDWFILLNLGGCELGFMLPEQDSQAAIFRKPFTGQGIWIAIDVEDAAAEFDRLKQTDIEIIEPLKQEPWGDYHFVVRDPNGIGVDIVQHNAPAP